MDGNSFDHASVFIASNKAYGKFNSKDAFPVV
jgi:hypothetical protein